MNEIPPPQYPFLIQGRMQFLGDVGSACAAQIHQQDEKSTPPANWEVRFYQSTERMLDFAQQGLSREEIAQRLWEESCREQDTIGVVRHASHLLCQSCVQTILVRHAGEESAFLTMSTAQVTYGCLLIVSDRATTFGRLLGNFPCEVEDRALLAHIEQMRQAGEILDLTPPSQSSETSPVHKKGPSWQKKPKRHHRHR